MKKIMIILLVVLLTGCGILNSQFEDRNLEIGVDRALRQMGLGRKDYDAIKHLDLSFLSVESLEGIEKLKNLESLDLSDNLISDLSPLKKLKALRILDFQNNQVKDLTTLLSLENLEVLLIRNNPIESITIIEPLFKQLKTTDFLTQIDFEDEAFEIYMRSLLDKPKEQITFYDLGKIKRIDLTDSSVSSIAGIEHAHNLEYLVIPHEVTGLGEISQLSNLKSLQINNNRIINMTFIMGLEKLIKLDLSHNSIEDISAIEAFTFLEYLDLSVNKIKDLSPLLTQDHLKELYLESNYIVSYDGISDVLNQVEKTDIFIVYFRDANLDSAIRAQLNKMDGVITKKDFNSITSLNVSNSGIEDLGGIEMLINVVELDLSYNNVIDITDLKALNKLKILKASHNQISDLSVLKYLEELQIVDLTSNEIESIDAINYLSLLDYLLLEDNLIEFNDVTEAIKEKIKYTDEWFKQQE